MQSKMTYRDAPAGDIKLPKEVYYRCLWTVRDADRLRMMASVLDADRSDETDAKNDEKASSVTHAEDAILISEESARRAAYELGCIERAYGKIPEVYREGLSDNIVSKTPFPDFAHPNTWKRWKLVLLYELARELRLI